MSIVRIETVFVRHTFSQGFAVDEWEYALNGSR